MKKCGFIIFLCSISIVINPAKGSYVLIISSLNIPLYGDLEKEITKSISIPVKFINLESGTNAEYIQMTIRKTQPSEIITIGKKATKLGLNYHGTIPLIYCMVVFPEEIIPKNEKQVYGISMMAKPEHFVKLIENLTQVEKVFVLYDPKYNENYLNALKETNASFKIEIISPPEEKKILNWKPDTKEKCAVILLPTTHLLTDEVISYLCKLSVINSFPIIGFSPNQIKNGAALSLFLDNKSISTKIIEIENSLNRKENISTSWPYILYPGNSKVSYSLKLCSSLSLNTERIKEVGGIEVENQ